MARQDGKRTAHENELGVRLPVAPVSERHGSDEKEPRSVRRRGFSSLWHRDGSGGERSAAGKVKWPKRSRASDYERFNRAFSALDETETLSRPRNLGGESGRPPRADRPSFSMKPSEKEPAASALPEHTEPALPPAPPRAFSRGARGVETSKDLSGAPASRAPASHPAADRAGPPPKEPSRLRLLRIFFGVAIAALAAGVYLYWEEQELSAVAPPMVMPQPYFYEEEQPVSALLLWNEEVVKSPVPGTVQLTFGAQPAAVAANDVVATVLSRGKTTTVRSPSRGYFLPALDGAESRWNYGSLWLGSGLLPQAPQNSWIEDLASLRGDRIVGKLIFLPQNPRAVFYVNLTDRLSQSLQLGAILIRRASKGPKWTAHVRVFRKYDQSRAKVVIDMPCFPMDMVLSRQANFLVCSDEDSGLIVPGTAVVLRRGTYGVFELVGDRIEFRKVTGKPVSDGRFFVASGLQPGNPVILNAANAEEKRVRLW